MPTREIEVSDADWEFVQNEVASGRYASPKEVLEGALRKALQRELEREKWLEENAEALAAERVWIEENGVPILPAEPAWNRIVTVVPGVRGGRPVIRDMRIAVEDILGWLASGMSEAEMLKDYPELTTEDIRAALAFAADHIRTR